MMDYADLRIGLYRQDAESYAVELHFRRPDDQAERAPQRGVARFDGEAWHNLSTQDGLAGNIVYSIERDSEGAFWFGTDAGLSRYDGSNWQTFTTSEGLAGNHVYAIQLTDSGEIWAGTQGGVSRLGKQ